MLYKVSTVRFSIKFNEHSAYGCSSFNRQYVRNSPAPTVGQKPTGAVCRGGKGARACRGGQLIDNILDWEHDLPDKDLDMAINHAW